MLHQKRVIRQIVKQWSKLPREQVVQSPSFNILKAQVEKPSKSLSDFSVDPMPSAWNWTGDLWRYLPTWMTLWFSSCPDSVNWVMPTSGMPENHLQLGTKEKGSAFSFAWTFSEVLILRNVLWSFLNALAHAVLVSPQHFTNRQYNTGI